MNKSDKSNIESEFPNPTVRPTLQKLESFHLHRVVELSAGIKDDYVAAAATDANKHHRVNPVEKLKEALSSKDAFQKYYLVRRAESGTLNFFFAILLR